VSTPTDAQRIAERYPVPPKRHRLYLALVAVLSLVLAAWTIWAGLNGSTPGITADVASFKVVSDHQIDGELRVQRSDPSLPGVCHLKATGGDFVQVGEVDAPIPAGTETMERVVVPVKTINKATTVEVISCRLA